MAKVRPETHEVNARVVYWGIEGAGKRTSLAGIYRKLRADHRGEMREVPTRFDPSVHYTVLPIALGDVGGVRTQIEVVAVPGGAEHAPTRKQLLDQVDGIVLVVDCQRERVEENLASFEELAKNLEDYALHIDEIPLVVQYNKCDLDDAFGAEELHRRLGLPGATAFESVATEGTGLLQTLSTVSKKVIRSLRGQSLDGARAAAPPAPPVAPVAAPVRDTAPAELMEEAILAEAEQHDAGEIDRSTHQAASLVAEGPSPPDAPGRSSARVGGDLVIVSTGEATRVDAHTVRLPLVVGDDEGGTSTLVLTLRLDALAPAGRD